MFCKLNSFSLNGIEALPIQVEIDLQDGLPGFDIVGLPDNAVKEAKNRVKSAIKNSGYCFPICHITINLSPADIKKEGSLYDLPIALGILCCQGIFSASVLEKKLFIGELALDGALRGVRGLLPILCEVLESNIECYLPEANHAEADLLENLHYYTAYTLKEIVEALQQNKPLPQKDNTRKKPQSTAPFTLDYADVHGQTLAKRGLMIAAAGYHATLLIGPPGSGKTMLAQRMPTILPPLSSKECIEITKIYSVAHQLSHSQMISTRPFRAPHHTISCYGLTGGGVHPKPGEISLAHLGVLFLDELLEFNTKTLEILREPLESHQITLSRAQISLTYPANFLFLASTNPCPCGYYPDSRCTCSMPQIRKYLSKLSGPLMDRIDLQLELHTPNLDEMSNEPILSSKQMRIKVLQAQHKQKIRFQNTEIWCNSQIPSNKISHYCKASSEALILLNQWFKRTGASMRAHDKILRLARTIADLDNVNIIDEAQIAEALHYRSLDYLH